MINADQTLDLDTSFGSSWQKRRVVWTKETIAFSRLDQKILIDKIPFPEITSIHDMSNEADTSHKQSMMERASTSARALSSSVSFRMKGASKSGDGNDDIPKTAAKTSFLGNISSGARRLSTAISAEVISAALEGRGNLNIFQIETQRDGYNLGRTYYLRAPTESLCKKIVEDLQYLAQKAKKRAELKSRVLKIQRKVRIVYWSFPFQCFVGLLIMMVRDDCCCIANY